MIRLRWFLVLCSLFLTSLAADCYLSAVSTHLAGVVVPERFNAADFLASATAGELSTGTITYRMNSAGLADLAATRTHGGKIGAVQATARLTDVDLGLLLCHQQPNRADRCRRRCRAGAHTHTHTATRLHIASNI